MQTVNKFILAITLITCLTSCTNQSVRLLKNTPDMTDRLMVGSFTTEAGSGITLLDVNLQNGKSDVLHTMPAANASYQVYHPKMQRVYSVSMDTKSKQSVVHVYTVSANNDAIELTQTVDIGGRGACHIALDSDGNKLAVVNYSTGDMSYLQVDPVHGTLTKVDEFANLGRSVTQRQTAPHLHYANWDSENRHLYVTDLGTDEILIFSTDDDLQLKHRQKTAKGSGPRHLAFHPRLSLVYAVNELNHSVSWYAINPDTGALSLVDSVVLSASDGPNLASAIRISSDGRFLYTAVRGDDTLHVYAIDDVGTLKQVQVLSSGGEHPRDLQLATNGKHMYVANQYSDQINVFAREQQSGRLTPVGKPIITKKPASILDVTKR